MEERALSMGHFRLGRYCIRDGCSNHASLGESTEDTVLNAIHTRNQILLLIATSENPASLSLTDQRTMTQGRIVSFPEEVTSVFKKSPEYYFILPKGDHN